MASLGTFKWFDVEGGYGLISPDDGGRNLFTRNMSTAGEGLKSLAKGDKVAYEVLQGRNGSRAVNVSKDQLRYYYYRRGSPGQKPPHHSNMAQEEEDGAELLNWLYSAQTEEQIDAAAAESERWLVEHPHDEGVSLARDQAMRRRAGAPPHGEYGE
jgi:cold shock protein